MFSVIFSVMKLTRVDEEVVVMQCCLSNGFYSHLDNHNVMLELIWLEILHHVNLQGGH